MKIIQKTTVSNLCLVTSVDSNHHFFWYNGCIYCNIKKNSTKSYWGLFLWRVTQKDRCITNNNDFQAIHIVHLSSRLQLLEACLSTVLTFVRQKPVVEGCVSANKAPATVSPCPRPRFCPLDARRSAASSAGVVFPCWCSRCELCGPCCRTPASSHPDQSPSQYPHWLQASSSKNHLK